MRSFGILLAAITIGLLQGAKAQYDPAYEEFNWQLVTDVFDETVYQLEQLDVSERDAVLDQILTTAFEVNDHVQSFFPTGGAVAALNKPIGGGSNKRPSGGLNKNKFGKGKKSKKQNSM